MGSVAMGLLRCVPAWLWLVLAILAWGGVQRCQGKAAAARVAVAERGQAVAQATAAGQLAARQAEQRNNKRVREVADAAHQKVLAAHEAAAAAAGELERLRAQTAGAGSGGATETGAAAGGSDDAAAARAVVGSCAIRLLEVATAADTCAARLTGLQDYVSAILAEQEASP
jgi:hypothetical protein